MDSSRQNAGSGTEPFPSVSTTVTHEGPTTHTTTTTTSHTLQVPESTPSRARSNSRRSPVPSSRPIMQSRPSTIRIRRMPSSPALPQEDAMNNYGRVSPVANRQRTASEPQGPHMLPTITGGDEFNAPQAAYMPPVHEEAMHTILEHHIPQQHSDRLAPATADTGRLRSASNATRRGLNRMSSRLSATPSQAMQRENEYESEVTDLLDVVGKISAFLKTNNESNIRQILRYRP